MHPYPQVMGHVWMLRCSTQDKNRFSPERRVEGATRGAARAPSMAEKLRGRFEERGSRRAECVSTSLAALATLNANGQEPRDKPLMRND
jgi:hypothetical protein